MSDIGPIHGLGALIIFLGLLFINCIFLIFSIIFLLIEKKKGSRIVQKFNAKGLFISTLILAAILVLLSIFIEYSHDQKILEYVDLASPIFAIAAIIAMIIINFKYSKHNSIE